MARVSNGQMSGKVGNLVYYQVGGKTYVRTAPAKKLRDHSESKQSRQNILFKSVAKYGTAMVARIATNLGYRPRIVDYNKVRGWIYRLYSVMVTRDAFPVTGYPMNVCGLNQSATKGGHIYPNLNITDNGNGNIQISFPEINPRRDIPAPSHTLRINFTVIAAISSFGADNNIVPKISSSSRTVEFVHEMQPPGEIFLDTGGTTGDVILIALRVTYTIFYAGRETIESKIQWLPITLLAFGKLQ